MIPEVLRGILLGIALVLCTAIVGTFIGFACSGGDYDITVCDDERVCTQMLDEDLDIEDCEELDEDGAEGGQQE